MVDDKMYFIVLGPDTKKLSKKRFCRVSEKFKIFHLDQIWSLSYKNKFSFKTIQ